MTAKKDDTTKPDNSGGTTDTGSVDVDNGNAGNNSNTGNTGNTGTAGNTGSTGNTGNVDSGIVDSDLDEGEVDLDERSCRRTATRSPRRRSRPAASGAG